MAFPSTLDTFSTKIDGVSDVLAQDINALQNSVITLQAKVGVNAGWLGVTGSRSFGTTYTNSSASKRIVIVSATSAQGINFNITGSINGSAVAVSGGYSPSLAQYHSLVLVVPPSGTYRCDLSGLGSLSSWSEHN